MIAHRRSLILALTVSGGAFLFLRGRTSGPDSVLAQKGNDDVKIVPLDVKPGLWEVQMHSSNTDVSYAASEAAMEQMTKTYTAEQRDKAMADYKVNEQKAIANRKKGTDRQYKWCPLKQDFEWKVQATGPNCSKQVSSTAQQFRMQVACKADDGTAGYAQNNKFTRIDDEHFQGTIEVVSHVPAIGTVTATYTGKWISDSCSGPPAGYAAKNGLHPKGPSEVARDDPNRVVAVIDGKEITAQQGWNMIQKVPPSTRNSYKTGLSGLLERVYLQNAIADEATKLHLDKQQPWKDKLAHAKQVDLQVHQNYAGDPNIPPEVWANWLNDQQHILWNAYFSQGPTKAANDALLQRKKDQYKITVKDPDFFAGGPQ
jgi:hypothetical protein